MPRAERSRDALLDAAEELFSRRGFAATTIKAIGRQAGANPALLYYYFGSKESLYQAVLDRLADGLVARGAASIDSARTPDDAIRGMVAAQAGFLTQHPRAPALLIREMLEQDSGQVDAFVTRIAAQLFHRLCGAIEAGQRTGRFRADLDPRFAAISSVAQIVYFHLARPAIRVLLRGEASSFPTPALQERFARHAGEFAVAALRGDSTAGTRRRTKGRRRQQEKSDG